MKILKLLLIIFLVTSTYFNEIYAQNITPVTIHLSTNTIANLGKDSVFNIGVRGNVAPLQWVSGIKLKDADKDGIYSITIPMVIEKTIDVYFKFVLNEVAWESGEARKMTLHPKVPFTYDASFDFVKRPGNPFKKFIGEWALKADTWENGDGKTPNIKVKIPGHHTVCKEVNTDNSLLWVVDATSARGHILWVYDHANEKVAHVSSFMPFRSGVGEGAIDDHGNVTLKVVFEGEPKDTYRQYSYTWLNVNEYVLESRRFGKDGKATGDFYGGTFVRVQK